MSHGDPDPAETGVTVELSADEIRGSLPARAGAVGPGDLHPDDLREALPGLEPDRHVTDWGRSERVEGLVDRTVYEFCYRYWFRVEADGLDNVPGDGGALLLANHGGAVLPAAAMIAKTVAEEHARPRRVHLAIDRPPTQIPGLGMLATKVGAVAAHPANLHRLLFDEQQLVLAFPEGRLAAGKPLSERYRLRPFAQTQLIEGAIRADVPIVPVAVIGAEEALPVFARINPLSRLTRLPRFSVSTGFPLPAKFRIRFLEPVGPGELEQAGTDGGAQVRVLADDIRALIGENLLEMVSERRSVWLG